VPLLASAGHDIVASTRKPENLATLETHGAKPILLNGLDAAAVMRAVMSVAPDAIVHEMTALASLRSFKYFDDEFAATNRLRTDGTKNLIEAARAAGVPSLIAQSYAGWPSVRRGGRIKTESDSLSRSVPVTMTKSLAAIRTLEETVCQSTDVRGAVLRYGSFYGPGTYIAPNGEMVDLVRKGKFPIVGTGSGVWSFIHVDDAARATLLALERGATGLFNIVDDEPVEVSIWLPELARIVGAKPPRHLPVWLARWLVGDAGILMMTEARGASNAKAKAELGWQPDFFNWRDGFRHELGARALVGVR
jgi:nucleoside-diphosphate-sugar epimerase